MEEISTIVYDFIRVVKESSTDKELFRHWLTNRFDEAIENCTMYVNMEGWDNDNIVEYKYFHTDRLEDVVRRQFERVANNFLIAME